MSSHTVLIMKPVGPDAQAALLSVPRPFLVGSSTFLPCLFKRSLKHSMITRLVQYEPAFFEERRATTFYQRGKCFANAVFADIDQEV